MDLSQRLKDLRIQHELTQNELASHLFLSRQTISKWETNRSQPDLDTLLILADLYKLSLQDLIGDKDFPLIHSPNLSATESKKLLSQNKERMDRAMITKSAKKFLLLVTLLVLLVIGFRWGQAHHESQQLENMAIYIKGAKDVKIQSVRETNGMPVRYVTQVTLKDGTTIDYPTLSQLEEKHLIGDKSEDAVKIWGGMLKDFYHDLPLEANNN